MFGNIKDDEVNNVIRDVWQYLLHHDMVDAEGHGPASEDLRAAMSRQIDRLNKDRAILSTAVDYLLSITVTNMAVNHPAIKKVFEELVERQVFTVAEAEQQQDHMALGIIDALTTDVGAVNFFRPDVTMYVKPEKDENLAQDAD